MERVDVTENNMMQVFAKIAIALVEKCGDEVELNFDYENMKYKIVINAEEKRRKRMKTNNINEQLKPCPFCGGIPKILITDDEGNIHDTDYEDEPFSGLAYELEHDYEKNEDCPIARHADESLGVWLYDSREEAIEAWNTRYNNND